MRYIIHKCCKLNSNPNRIFDLECPDYCDNEKEASTTFKDAFRHHIGVYPTKEQIERFLSFDNIFVEQNDVTYIFYMTI
jgi:hypothetical protein